jgi:hypothetical protein
MGVFILNRAGRVYGAPLGASITGRSPGRIGEDDFVGMGGVDQNARAFFEEIEIQGLVVEPPDLVFEGEALGLERAKQRRDELAQEAEAALAGFGEAARVLVEAARFTAARRS